jgi:ferrochelatase
LIGRGYQKIMVIPLFPHHSLSMTESIVSECERVARLTGRKGVEIGYIKSWIDSPSFIKSWEKQIRLDMQPHILFSAHSIPTNHIARGCPYRSEVERSVEMIEKELGSGAAFHLAYQSGRRSNGWLGPSIENKLDDLLKQGVKNCAVVPLSFVFENVETLVDLDINIIPKFQRLGMKGLKRVAVPGPSPEIINTLAELTESFIRP